MTIGGAARTDGSSGIQIGLSSASVYPESTGAAFAFAKTLGYQAVEVMVGMDPESQDVNVLARLIDRYQMPVCAIHAPCLLITQRVWGSDPWTKLRRSAEAAQRLNARTVVVHPPFRWQREYVTAFVEGIADLEADTGVAFAVENMFPWRASRRSLKIYQPSWDPVDQPYRHVTLDTSHTSTSLSDPLAMATALGPRLHHVHIGDGTGSAKDEHLVPGRGNQPCAPLLQKLVADHFAGWVVVEINTRRAAHHGIREADLAESLEFTRRHLTR